MVIGGMEAAQDLDGGLGGFGKLSRVGTGHGAAELSLTHQGYHIFGELGIVTGELQATGSAGDAKERRPTTGKEGVAAVSEDEVAGIRLRQACRRAAGRAHEGTAGARAAQDGLSGEEARQEVEEGTPAGAFDGCGGIKRLDDDASAVVEHGALSGGELALSAKLKVAPFKRDGAVHVEGESQYCNAHATPRSRTGEPSRLG